MTNLTIAECEYNNNAPVKYVQLTYFSLFIGMFSISFYMYYHLLVQFIEGGWLSCSPATAGSSPNSPMLMLLCTVHCSG